MQIIYTKSKQNFPWSYWGKENSFTRIRKEEKDIARLKQTKCVKGCEDYNKTIHEIAEAASKHREKLVALKEVADTQKNKIFCLRGHRNKLFDEIDKLKLEHDMEIKERIFKL